MAQFNNQYNQGQYNSGFNSNRFNQNKFNQKPTPAPYRPGSYKQPAYKPTPAPYKPVIAIDPVPVAPPVRPIVTKYNSQEIPILRQTQNINDDGSYEFSYETANGISAGETRTVSQQQPNGQVVGSYRYTSPEGTPIDITYYADENGFQAQGDAIPVAPAIPELILRSLEYNRIHAGEFDDFGVRKAGFKQQVRATPSTLIVDPTPVRYTPSPVAAVRATPKPQPFKSQFQPGKFSQFKPFNQQGQYNQGQYKPRF